MAKRRICCNCKHWISQVSDGNPYINPDFGQCELIEDLNDVERKDMKPDRIYSWDYESYRSGADVGKNFSCKHWQSKTYGEERASKALDRIIAGRELLTGRIPNLSS